jgi:DNA-binding NtrC family response regulator
MPRQKRSMIDLFVSAGSGGSSFEPSLTRVVRTMKGEGLSYRQAVRMFESSYISQILQQQAGHRGKTARALGIHQNTLTRRLRPRDNHPECIEVPATGPLRR